MLSAFASILVQRKIAYITTELKEIQCWLQKQVNLFLI